MYLTDPQQLLSGICDLKKSSRLHEILQYTRAGVCEGSLAKGHIPFENNSDLLGILGSHCG
jgi:hypothetical protein